MTRSFDIDEWLVLVVIALVIVSVAGCACPGDDLRLVQPIQWHELDRTDLAVACRDVDPALKGCVVSGASGDSIYLLKR